MSSSLVVSEVKSVSGSPPALVAKKLSKVYLARMTHLTPAPRHMQLILSLFIQRLVFGQNQTPHADKKKNSKFKTGSKSEPSTAHILCLGAKNSLLHKICLALLWMAAALFEEKNEATLARTASQTPHAQQRKISSNAEPCDTQLKK